MAHERSPHRELIRTLKWYSTNVIPFLIPLLLALQTSTVNPKLTALADAQAKVGYTDHAAMVRENVRAERALKAMMDADELKTADDFFAATELLDNAPGYESRLLIHEWAVSALVLGHPDAVKRVKLTWDRLQLASGRPQRFGIMTRRNDAGESVPRPTDPTLASLTPATGTDNPELRTLHEADYADRKGSMDAAVVGPRDDARRARVLAILKEGRATTGEDAYNAASVMQHGDDYADFMLAHELCLSAIARGYKGGAWLLSRTYDRMLESGGQAQRFDTQLTPDGKMNYVLNVATPGPSDTTRRLFGAESRAYLRAKTAAWEASIKG